MPNTVACSAAGSLSAGAICAETVTHKTSDLTFDEYISFLEPQPASSGLPARAGAICESPADWNAMATALEQECKALGGQCGPSIKEFIKSVRNKAQAPE